MNLKKTITTEDTGGLGATPSASSWIQDLGFSPESSVVQVLAALALSLVVLSAAAPLAVAGAAEQKMLRQGEAMYMKGLFPSGQPMKAVVQGDMELTGKMTTCANCHRRSGLGSLEGGVVTPPANGAKLYVPLQGQADIPGSVMKRSLFKNPRPAYTDEALANAILHGIDPTGRKMSDTMPRYLLDEESAKIMISYLKALSSTISPGVTGDEIRFATIVTDQVSREDREAMLLPLQAYLREEWNARLSVLGSQWNTRWYGTSKSPDEKTYRKASLDVWELKGPPPTWTSQLESHYRQKPVFAMLGGLAPGKWAPIHDFCEKNRIPCILPITDFPVISTTDWYTLYFSKGLYQEGEAAAKYLSRIIDLPENRQIVQVYRDESEGSALAQGFADTWKKLGKAKLTNRTLSAAGKPGGEFWKTLAASYPDAVLLIWLGPADMAGMDALAEAPGRPATVLASATLLAGSLAAIPDKVRDFTFITYPTRLPGDEEYSRSIATSWLKMKKIPVTNLAISAKMYLLTRLLSTVMLDMGRDLYRDFFLDLLDDSVDQLNSSVSYPALTFGPGQRYAAKGCYIVTLTRGENPKVVRQSDWVIY